MEHKLPLSHSSTLTHSSIILTIINSYSTLLKNQYSWPKQEHMLVVHSVSSNLRMRNWEPMSGTRKIPIETFLSSHSILLSQESPKTSHSSKGVHLLVRPHPPSRGF